MDIIWTGSPCCSFRRDHNSLPTKDGRKRRSCRRVDVGYHVAQTVGSDKDIHLDWPPKVGYQNKAFNELATYWHADHVYKHTVGAIEAFWLITMLAYNLFHTFITLTLKSAIRHLYTKLHLARTVAMELYGMNNLAKNARAP